MERMGVLEGMTDLSTGRNLEFLPSFTVIRYESIDDVTGLACPGTDPEGCVNVKYGITPNHEKREGTLITSARRATCALRVDPEFPERHGWPSFPGAIRPASARSSPLRGRRGVVVRLVNVGPRCSHLFAAVGLTGAERRIPA